jgi:hypothetical protein
MFIVFDGDRVGYTPMADLAHGQRTGCGGDLILLCAVNVTLDKLQASIRTGSDAKADASGGRGAFCHGASDACASNTGDV